MRVGLRVGLREGDLVVGRLVDPEAGATGDGVTGAAVVGAAVVGAAGDGVGGLRNPAIHVLNAETLV